MNDSQVIPARLYGSKSTGGKVELLVERIIGECVVEVHIKASKSPQIGSTLFFEHGWQMEVLERLGGLYRCQVSGPVSELLHSQGHIPLPPYIRREDELNDVSRYQTVYARHEGSVAAPTAGLHFDEALLHHLVDEGVNIAHSTLHVGAGTFQPVRCHDLREHTMHAERLIVSEALCEAVNATHDAGGRVIAVGTTAVRSLESAGQSGVLKPFQGETDIFIYPGYEFKICDGLLTNFHLPESTLLMLVSAFIGHQKTMSLYQTAIENRYRFYSYGDAMLLL